jgi:hypothetical protein
MGYSLNDTIIVYDRIRENMAVHTKHNLVDVLNRSVNETLSRTLLTSLNTLATVLCLLLVGGEVIFGFALAMVIGIVVGTYSSIFVAAPILLFLEQRFGGARDAKPTGKPGRVAERRSGRRPRSRRSRRGDGRGRAQSARWYTRNARHLAHLAVVGELRGEARVAREVGPKSKSLSPIACRTRARSTKISAGR